MEKLVVEGLCVSHSIVLENQENITKQLCQQYLGEEIVCPRNFEKWLFTVAVIDNKDHGPSSPKIKYSFQGTSISVWCAKEKKAIYLIGSLLLKTHMNSFLAIFHEF